MPIRTAAGWNRSLTDAAGTASAGRVSGRARLTIVLEPAKAAETAKPRRSRGPASPSRRQPARPRTRREPWWRRAQRRDLGVRDSGVRSPRSPGTVHRRTRRAREHSDDQQDPEFPRVGCGHVQQLQHGDTDRTAEHDRPTTDTVEEPTGDGPDQQHADGEHAERQADVGLRTAEFLLDETRQHRKGEPTDAEVERRRRETASTLGV